MKNYIVAAPRKVIRMGKSIARKRHTLEKAEINRPKEKIKPGVKFISHQLEMSGAPLLFMQVVADFHKRYSEIPLEFHTYSPANPINIKALENVGIQTIVHSDLDMPVVFNEDDIVVLNTTAYASSVRSSIYNDLYSDKIRKVIWYIHEDWPQTHFGQAERKAIPELMANGKLSMYVPAIKTRNNYQAFFKNKTDIHLLPSRLDVEQQFKGTKTASQFNKLTFVMTGQPADLKGNLPILYAFLFFKNFYYDKNRKVYRDFEFRIVGLEQGGYTAEYIRRHSPALGRHYKNYPPVSHAKALSLIKESNITISYSIRECLPVSVFEGMYAGHPILRNDSSGMEEQLTDGKNGFLLSSNNFEAVVRVIEKILNTKKTSNEDLAEMSKISYRIAAKQGKKTYEHIFKEIIHSLESKRPKY